MMAGSRYYPTIVGSRRQHRAAGNTVYYPLYFKSLGVSYL
jgi:hypothetical protein